MSRPLSIHDRFIAHLRQQHLLLTGQKALLAVSGGMDSMAMVELFRASSHPFAIAHCNFQLRGQDAEKDQAFVRQQAAALGVDCYTERFDTKAYEQQHHLSIQMAARELRYDWLEETRQRTGCEAIATGHHLDDSIETLLMNLIRGTGIEGLKGIPVKQGKIIRPLMFADRKEIEGFVNKHQIPYRKDLSNEEEIYLRNKIRRQLIPVMREINPSLSDTTRCFFQRMQGKSSIYFQAVNRAKKACITTDEGETRIDLDALFNTAQPELFLHEFLKAFGFTPATSRDIFNKLPIQPGREFLSTSHRLLSNRNELLVLPMKQAEPIPEVQLHRNTHTVKAGGHDYHCSTGNMEYARPQLQDSRTLLVDLEKIQFPLLLRPWKAGDKFVPLGMRGHKKVSDLLTEAKIPKHKKMEVMVLLSAGQIVWVVGLRSAERFKLDSGTRHFFMMEPAIP